MLTGPVTILNWSFNRIDVSREVQAKQLALALRDEVVDLAAAKIQAIQVDEPAIREGVWNDVFFCSLTNVPLSYLYDAWTGKPI